jgi:hypothetical protein
MTLEVSLRCNAFNCFLKNRMLHTKCVDAKYHVPSDSVSITAIKHAYIYTHTYFDPVAYCYLTFEKYRPCLNKAPTYFENILPYSVSCNLYSSPSIIRIIKSRRMSGRYMWHGWERRGTCVGYW